MALPKTALVIYRTPAGMCEVFEFHGPLAKDKAKTLAGLLFSSREPGVSISVAYTVGDLESNAWQAQLEADLIKDWLA